MKKFFKALAVVMALTLVIGTIPASAATTGPKTAKKLYIDGAKGEDDNGVKSSVKKSVSYAYLLGITKEEAAKATAKSADSKIAKARDDKGRVYAKKIGKTTVTLTYKGKDYKVKVTVKKNAEKVNFGADWANVEDTFEAEAGQEYTVSLPRLDGSTKLDTDQRRLESDESVVITPVEGQPRSYTVKFTKGGQHTVTGIAYQSKTYPKATASKAVTVTVNSDFDAQATGVKEITVDGAGFTKDTKFTVKKGTSAVDVASVTVSEDGTSAKLALGNKISEGKYTVSDGANEATFNAENERVKNIVVLEDGGEVLTSSNRKSIFVHYDVFNQYDESVRKSFSVSWTSSFGGTPKLNNTTEGILQFTGTDAIVYGTQIVLTGVYAKNGVTVTANMKAGMEQYVDTVDVKGVVKVDDKKTSDTVPAGFRANTYAIYFSLKDKNGNPMKYDADQAKNVTITSQTPLVAEVKSSVENKPIVINGTEYAYVYVNPGYNAAKGGKAELLLISTKTGGKTPYTLEVSAAQVLKSFTILEYGDILAEGDGASTGGVELPFEALDYDDKPITDFSVLVDDVNLTGTGLRLVEDNKGKAHLKYIVPVVGATETVDVPQLLMATVIKSGENSSIMPSIKEARKAVAVKGFDQTPYIIEGGKLNLLYNAWSGAGYSDGVQKRYVLFYDQYEGEVRSSGYNIKVEFDPTLVKVNGATGGAITFAPGGFTVEALDDCVLKSEETVLTISLWDAAKNEAVAGSEKKVTVGIADISQVKEFTLNKADNTPTARANKAVAGANDYATFYVTGKLSNGSDVAVPYKYVDISAGAKTLNGGSNNFAATNSNGADISAANFWAADYTADAGNDTKGQNDFTDLSKKGADGFYKKIFVDFTFTANVYALSGSAIDTNVKIGSASYKLPVGDEARKLTSISYLGWKSDIPHIKWIEGYGNPITAYILPQDGIIDEATLEEVVLAPWGSYPNYGTDQYGAGMILSTFAIEISKYVENENGLYTDGIIGSSYSVSGSGTNNVTITDAEIGDTFVATYIGTDANGYKATLTINFTVGADTSAVIVPGANSPDWY